MIFTVIASGESMNRAVADSLRSRCKVIAVSDTYRLAPWADALVSSDGAWWKHHQDALLFSGKKFTLAPYWHNLAGVDRFENVPYGTNSGLLGLMVAASLGATKILMLGFDMKGGHFFGQHELPLKNPDEKSFARFMNQFSAYRPKGIDIVNCTPGSALDCYPVGDVEKELC